jgi:tol-pal system protein YbgF
MWGTRTALTVCLLLGAASVSAAPSRAELDARIQQLERKVDSRSLVDMMDQLKALQREVQQLRGDIEVQTHSMEGLQKRQRDLYLDIDRRLHRLEVGGGQTQPGASSGTTPEIPAQGGGAVRQAPAATGGTAAPAAAAATLSPADERKDYDRALELLKEGRYKEASPAFQDFLTKYPSSSYADNAQYWLGEVFYVTREFDAALSEFGKVVESYPGSSKVADAKLKMGYIEYERKDWEKARGLLTQVVQAYPGTTTARLAQERLDRMKREGH